LAAPLHVQKAMSRLWDQAKRFDSEDRAYGSVWFSQLACECHNAYGAPPRYSEPPDETFWEDLNVLQWHEGNLKRLFRNIGAPWYDVGTSPGLATAADIIDFAYQGGPFTRVYLAPLDRAPENMPRTEFGPCRVGRFSAAELAAIIKSPALIRHQRNQFDLDKFSRFAWLVVEEPVHLKPAAERDWITRLLNTSLKPSDTVDIYSRRLPKIVERALVTLLLHPWEDFVNFANQDWRPFVIPWFYTVNNDPFEVPRSAPNFASLSWEPYLSPEDELIEHDRPKATEFEQAAFGGFEALQGIWELLAAVVPLGKVCYPAVNQLIEHFLLRAYFEKDIDELIMHTTAIDAAIGRRQNGMTKAIGKRLKRLLSGEVVSQEFERLYDLRSAYVHGRGVDKPLQTSDLISARRLARQTTQAVLCYANDNPEASRSQLLDYLERKP
jgi:hypothetical protein